MREVVTPIHPARPSNGRSQLSKDTLMRCCRIVVFALLVPAAALAQEFRATVAGNVTDASGAAIPGANVLVVETRTGTRSETVSDSTGQYVVPFLAPGDYEVRVQLQGFKEYSRKALHLAS